MTAPRMWTRRVSLPFKFLLRPNTPYTLQPRQSDQHHKQLVVLLRAGSTQKPGSRRENGKRRVQTAGIAHRLNEDPELLATALTNVRLLQQSPRVTAYVLPEVRSECGH
ncbi:hypothetical protein EVAR_71057_1 [Eumeta japonica]|uniref:Uncharacterized protein n=1 Tax=Eumeta variegata TaxID=151549 RepID=A0A4C1TJZ2_EUMVA|nr:hypothetical protein EVAR_71057_1 [Eumeta japonica]